MKVLVIGDSCIDEFVYGSTRMNPEAPTPVFKPYKTTNNFGMAGNVTNNVMAIMDEGDTVELMTHEERIIKRRFVDETSNYILLRVDEEDTTLKALDHFGSGVHPSMVIENYDVVIISDYNKGFLTKDVIGQIARRSKLTFLDTKKPLGSWCDDVDFIKINELEFNNPVHQEDGLMLSLRDKLIVTLGSKGARYKDKVYPAIPVEVRDVVGAGDTFMAAFAVLYWKTKNIDQAIEFANKCSAQVVTKKGVAMPDPKLFI